MKNYLLTLFRPVRSFERVLSNKNYFAISFLYISIPIAGYTAMYIFLTIANGAPSVFNPWLNIPKDQYYSINRFLLAPSMILCWLAATSVMQIIGRLNNGAGKFEQMLSVTALGISISMLAGLLHDLPMSALSALGVIDAREHEIAMNSPTIYRTLLWVSYSIYLIAFLVLFPAAVKTVHKLTWIKSIFAGITGFIIFQVIFFVFNR